MASKSDSADPERISATDASRSFSEILDQVSGGRSFVVVRHGQDVCEISPPRIEGRLASECLALLRSRSEVRLDAEFGADLLGVMGDEIPGDPPTWDS